MATNTLYCIIGPSGVGKTTLMDGLRTYGFTEALSHTTRKCRGGDDVNSYHFITREEFDRMVENGELVEHAEYNGNMYGISFASLDAGDFMLIELSGLKALKELYDHRPIKVIALTAHDFVVACRVLERDGNTDRVVHDQKAFKNYTQLADVIIRSENRQDTLRDTIRYLLSCGDHIPKEGINEHDFV